MPKIFYLIPVIVGLSTAMGMQYYLANSGIPESDQTSIHFVGVGISMFLSALSMGLIEAYFQRKKKKDEEEYKF